MPKLQLLRRRISRRLRALTDRRALDRELDEELGFHLEMEVEHNVRQGLSPEAARAKALREFGGMTRVKEEARDARGIGALEDVARDVRFAARSLRRSPGYTTVAALTLALGIGVTAAVFSVVDGVLLRPLPYPEPDRLVRLYERTPGSDRSPFAGANVRDVQAGSRTLSRVAYYSSWQRTVLGVDEPVRATVSWASREFFDVLGVPALHGRTPAPDEGTAGGPGVAVVTHEFWQTAFGGDPKFAARTLRVGSDAYAVVGVMPPGFRYPARADLWLTIVDDIPSRTAHNYQVIGRLAPGATIQQARAEVDALLRRLKVEHGEGTDAVGATVGALHDELTRTSRTTLVVLMGAVAFVLLVACVNLASANLARGETRRRELAVRTALGAGRGRLVRQLLTENLLLAAAGGALGVGLAYALTRLLAASGPGAVPAFAQIRVDVRVLAFAAFVSLVTGLLVGVAPAWQVTRNLRGAIGGGGSAAGGGRLRTRGVLIGAEVALALVLLAGAGLLVKSLRTLLDTDPGFRTERVLTASVALPSSIYSDAERAAGFLDRLLAELRGIPGVEAAGVTSSVPLGGGGGNTGFMVDGGTEIAEGYAAYRVVDSTYFRALGIPLLRGRGFMAADRPGAPHVALVNQALARKVFPGTSPIGHRLRPPGMDSHAAEWLTIVGVVGDTRDGTLDAPPEPAMFIHYPQRPENLTSSATVVLRATTPAGPLSAAVRERVRAMDPNVPVTLSTLDGIVADSIASRRFSTVVLTAFAALALFLAALGIYGVLAYSVAQRQREIGVRMALGAHQGTVRAMVLRDAMRAVLPGVAVGLLGAVALTRLLRGLLYGVSETDPATFAAVAVLLTAVAAAASWVPARRATKVDPMVAIRAE